MRVLHVLDHSIPLHSGYSFRTRNILRKQRDMGLETFHLTGPKHETSAGSSPAEETVEDLHFFRTPAVAGWQDRLPLYRHRAAIEAMIRRLDEVVRRIRPEVIHAHSPALNGVAAQRVADRHQLPLLYEVRAFWEDAAVDHGTASRFGLRYRLSRIEAEAPYDYLTGTRHRAAVEGRYRAAFDVRVGYELAYNDREDSRTVTTFTSVSPTRHEVFAEADYPLGPRWTSEAKAEYRLSRYHDANTDTATGLDRVRADDRVRLQIGLRRELPWELRASAEYERTVNDSNIAAYDYTANVYRLGVERFF